MTTEEKISYIIHNELLITQAIFNGHKSSDAD